jgi:hypothetical protein
MPLPDEQPLGIATLELLSIGGGRDGNDGAGAAGKRVSGDRKRPEHVDDDD